MSMNNKTQNIAHEYEIESGFDLIKLHNKTNQIQQYQKEIFTNAIQMHFCLHESVSLKFNKGTYGIDVLASKSLFLYNPSQELPMDVVLQKKAQMLSIIIPIEKLHSFFTEEAGIIDFLKDENKSKKYYTEKVISANESIILSQLMSHENKTNIEKLFLKAKVYELLSVYFQPQNIDTSNCPFLEEEENVEKIRQAKRLLIENMTNPPTIKELASKINLPLNYLKDGFKQIYGETVFNFLWEYKMEYARRMLNTKKYNVSEVSYEVGYSTPSHFIVAFKKKFNTTPKKYMSKL